MADREMIAATLAAALLHGRDFGGLHSNPAGYAVMVFRQVLSALEETAVLPPPQPVDPLR